MREEMFAGKEAKLAGDGGGGGWAATVGKKGESVGAGGEGGDVAEKGNLGSGLDGGEGGSDGGREESNGANGWWRSRLVGREEENIGSSAEGRENDSEKKMIKKKRMCIFAECC